MKRSSLSLASIKILYGCYKTSQEVVTKELNYVNFVRPPAASGLQAVPAAKKSENFAKKTKAPT